MNLFGRLLWVLLASWGTTKKPLQHVCSLRFRVWLHDLGWRDHLPNYRFYSFMELGRFNFWHGTRLAQSGRYQVRMIAAQDFTYLRPVSPLAKFRCDTQLISWDHKYFYFRHNFYVKGKLVGIGLVKEACLNQGRVINPALMIGNENGQHPVIDAWQTLQQRLKD